MLQDYLRKHLVNLNRNLIPLELPQYVWGCSKIEVTAPVERYHPALYNRCVTPELAYRHMRENLDFDPGSFKESDVWKLTSSYGLLRLTRSDEGFMSLMDVYSRLYRAQEEAKNKNLSRFFASLEEDEYHLLFLLMLLKHDDRRIRIDRPNFFSCETGEVDLSFFARYNIEAKSLLRYLRDNRVNHWYYMVRENQHKMAENWRPTVLPYEYDDRENEILQMMDCEDELVIWHRNSSFMQILVDLHKINLGG